MTEQAQEYTNPLEQEKLLPLGKGERVIELDVLRGFAIFGILLMNIEYFTTPLQDLFFEFSSYSGINNVVDVLTEIFITGKFVTLFSVLFGMGFAVMQIRSAKKGINFNALYLRRTGWLFVIGFVHTVFIWAGDILVSYALTGLLLLLFYRNTKTGRLWKHSLGLLLFLVLLTILGSVFSDGASSIDVSSDQANLVYYNFIGETYASGTFSEITQRRALDTLELFVIFPVSVLYFLSLFLFGAWLIKSGIMQKPKQHLDLFRKITLWGLPLGLIASVYAVTGFQGFNQLTYEQWTVFQELAYLLAPLILCSAYASAMILLVNKYGKTVSDFFAPVGRMALTNYILQSLVFSFIFFGYGLGYWGQLSRTFIVGMAIIFYMLQIIFSQWWMSKLNYGPLEWVWRRLTYGKLV